MFQYRCSQVPRSYILVTPGPLWGPNRANDPNRHQKNAQKCPKVTNWGILGGPLATHRDHKIDKITHKNTTQNAASSQSQKSIRKDTPEC